MANTYTAIANATVTSAGGESTMVFSNIPQTYTDLYIWISARTNRSSTGDALSCYLNADTTTSNYQIRQLNNNSSGAPIVQAYSTYNDELAFITAAGATSTIFGATTLFIPNYRDSQKKTVFTMSSGENDTTSAYGNVGRLYWTGTAAISTVTIKPITGTVFTQHSMATLYGIKNT
jgi:hypothetical protein